MTLPAAYVREAVELGYATTIHAAQGVTADTTHSLVDELMTREQLYTMLSRGRTANHLYLAVGGDGDPHTLLERSPREPTVTEILEQVLRRTSLPVSATTVREQDRTAALQRQGGIVVHARHRRPVDRGRGGSTRHDSTQPLNSPHGKKKIAGAAQFASAEARAGVVVPRRRLPWIRGCCCLAWRARPGQSR